MTDTNRSDALLARVRAVCFGFPGVEEKLSHGSPAFHVRGKMFLTFADGHHGDTRIAAWCKADLDRQQALVAEAPGRFFVPPYVGVRGWVGVDLGHHDMDWDELVVIVEEGWSSVAPKSVALGPVLPPPPAPLRPKTDPELSKRLRDKLEALCAELVEVDVERDTRSATFRVKKKAFMYFVDNHHSDGMLAAWLKLAPDENAALIAKDPSRFFMPPYLGPRGWVGLRLDNKKVDWKDVAQRVAGSYTLVAPKKRAPRAR